MLREITDLRRRNAELRAVREAAPAPVAPPVAPAPGTTTAPTTSISGLGNIPVRLSPDGSEVYVDQEALNNAIEKRTRELIRQAQQPSPEQVQQIENQRATDSFIASDPENNARVAGRAKEADDYITEQLKGLMGQGHKFNSLGEAVGLMQTLDITSKVESYFPELKGMVPQFVQGIASGDPVFRTMVLERMAGQSRVADTPTPNKEPGVRSLAGSPPSLARSGSRTPGAGAAESEFAELDREFSEKTVFMDEKRYKRLTTLGRQLGKDGYD